MHLVNSLLDHSLDDIVSRCERVWEQLAGARLFITGGTGFYGSWLIRSLVKAEQRNRLGVQILILCRDPGRFLRQNPHLADLSFLSFVAADVRNFDFPSGKFTHVIHAATDASEKLNREDPLLMIDTIVEGTRRVLDFAVGAGAHHFLNTSSGAVYGDIPPDLGPIPETYRGGPDIGQPKWAYGEAKRLSELLCCIYAEKHALETKNARCFATIGPGLPLGTHFAIGNFIADALEDRDIVVKGDGTPVRSYIDIADLTVWLWHILVFGRAGEAYNVGSEKGYAIEEIASKVRDALAPNRKVKVLGLPIAEQLASVYVPSTRKARNEMQLDQTVDLEQSIKSTGGWAMLQTARK